MNKLVAVAAVAVLAVLVVQAIVVAEEGVIVVNPAQGQPVKVSVGERMPGAWAGGGAAVPAVPTPPGVIGQYTQLPCSTPTSTGQMRGWGTDYLIRELGE